MTDQSLEQEYEGIYVLHWEVGRFVVHKGRRFFGLLQRVECWQLLVPDGFVWPVPHSTTLRHDPPRYYRMKLRGTLGPRGHFGHKGICRHQLRVLKVLSFEETDSPGKVW